MAPRKKLFDRPTNGVKFGMRKAVAQEEIAMPEPIQAQIEDAPEMHQAVLTEAMEDAQEMQEVHETVVKTSAEDHRLEFWLDTLKTSKKTRSHRSVSNFFSKKDSEQYRAVTDALGAVVFNTKVPFKDESRTNLNRIKNVSNAYYRLIDACETYLSKEGGKSQIGMARKGMVNAVLNLAKNDVTAVQQCYFEIYTRKIGEEEQSKLTWDEIIRRGREATIEVDDLHDDNIFKPLGGNAKTGDKASRLMKTGVFTKEEVQKTSVHNPGSFGAGAAFVDLKNNEGDYGSEVNITNRNVATSRMAGLLGLSDIIAESKTVNVRDKTTGNTFRGNMMEFAEGKEAKKHVEDLKPQMQQLKTIKEREDKILSMIAPKVQKDLTSLQVFDYICGQNDRHRSNYFMSKNSKGIFDGIKGIDNDQSFSTGIDYTKIYSGSGSYGFDKLRAVVGQNGELVIPYMDKQLAVNILNLSPDIIRFMLKDLLGPKFIENTIERLKLVQEAIRKEPSDSSRFKKDNEWNDETAKKMLNKAFFLRKKQLSEEKGIAYKSVDYQLRWDDIKESTYFGEMMLHAMGFNLSEGVFE